MTLAFAAALLALAVVSYVILPILQGQHAPLSGDGDELEDARARKKVALRALRDAEFDFAAGKLSQPDYQALKAELSNEALAAIDHADAVEESGSIQPAPAPEGPSGGAVASQDQVEREISHLRDGLRAGTTCQTCVHVNRAGSNFCTNCGRPLEGPVSVPSAT